MIVVLLASLLMIAATTLLHYEVLTALYRWVPHLPLHNRTRLLLVIFGAFLAHLLEIALYGVTLYVLVIYFDVGRITGGLPFTLENCIYFSAETYTSLGFGDLVPRGPVRLLAGVEALNGLLLVGGSASFAYLAMERIWRGHGPTPDA